MIGFVFAPSPRQVEPEYAAEICAGLTVRRVAVTKRPEQGLVDRIGAILRPDWLQADAEALARLVLPAGCAPLPVFRDGQHFPEMLPERLLYEGPISGQGRVADWDIAERLASRTQLFLAGGLNPGNVADAIRIVRPFGVDVSSGVEDAPGHKDVALIAGFIEAARRAARELE